MSNEMIERVANKIWVAMTFYSGEGLFEQQDLTLKKHYYGIAKAAIEAMREPIKEMFIAANCGDHEDDRAILKETYQAMIDVALNKENIK